MEENLADNITEPTPVCEEFIEDESQPKILQFVKTDLEYWQINNDLASWVC